MGESCRPCAGDATEVAFVVREARAEAAHREGRAHDERVAELGGGLEDLVHRVAIGDAGDVRARVDHELLEDLAVLALVDRLEVRTDELDVVLLEYPVVVQVDGGVERRLPTQRREDRVGPLLGDDRLDDLRRDRLDVGRVGEVGVGHDRRRVRVHEDDAHALLAEHPAGLGPRVVELARLADDDRAGPDDARISAWALSSSVGGFFPSIDPSETRRAWASTWRPSPGEVRARRGRGSGRRGSWRRAGRRPPRGGTAPRRRGCRARRGPRRPGR